jgi:putative hemolysin
MRHLKFIVVTQILTQCFFISVFAVTPAANNFSKKAKKSEVKSKETTKSGRPQVPKLKSDEYALFLQEKYIIFKTQKTDELELDMSCYTKNDQKPDCMAFTYAKMKAENIDSPNSGMNNMAAFHCAKMNGRNLLSIDQKNNEKDFCRFPDDSMVSSWSMYLRHHPIPVLD